MSLNSFQLSHLEAEEINKIIPSPYKLEAESNISVDILNQVKKLNNKSQIINNQKNKSHSRITISKQSQNISQNTKSKSSSLVPQETERKICENFYNYVKNCEYCNVFYTQKYLDEPCLIDIENKIRNRKYRFLLDIVMDLRNMCLYYSGKKSNTISFHANKLLEYVESTYKTFYKGMNKEYKNALKSALKLGKEHNKVLSEKDLIIMAEQIKKLNPKQLIGLVKLVRIQYNDNGNEKYYEINLGDLDLNTLNKINYYIKALNKV